MRSAKTADHGDVHFDVDRRALRQHTPLWVVDGFITILLLSSAFLPFDVPGRPTPNLAALPLLVVASIVLLGRRRWPLPVLVLCVGLFAAASVAGVVSPVFAIPVAISVYQVATTASRRVTAIATASAAIILPILSLATAPAALLEPGVFVSAQVIQLAAIIAFAGAFGDAAKSRRSTLKAYEDRAENAEATKETEARTRVAEDRLTIARDLHDLIAHQIAVINLHSSVASHALHERPADAEASLAVIRTASRTVLTEIGDLLSALRDSAEGESPTFISASLADTPTLIRQFRSAGLDIRSDVRSDVGDVAASLSEFGNVVAYQVLQEALTNALKHAMPARCAVAITATAGGEVVIVVENPVDPTMLPDVSSGHGIAGMRERLAIVGGTLAIERDGDRFRLEARIPVQRER